MARPPLLRTLALLFRGQTLLRIFMNEELRSFTLFGRVVDIGGGHNPDYFTYLRKDPDAVIEMVDGSTTGIDFESDALPYENNSVDTALLCNVLEHVYNHKHLVAEVHRVLAPSGTLIGFVPFWIGYHPDPRDYFRYTHEALRRILDEGGFSDVEIRVIGRGPVLANFNTLVLSVPKILRPLMYLWYAAVDALFLKLRPKAGNRTPLGYVFSAKKRA